jgi:hypothetical protein
MVATTKENLKLMRSVEEDSTTGLMENTTMENGKRIKCMVTVSLLGRMENAMKGTS